MATVTKMPCAAALQQRILTTPMQLLCISSLSGAGPGDSGTGYIQTINDRATVVAVHSGMFEVLLILKQNVAIILSPTVNTKRMRNPLEFMETKIWPKTL